MFLHKETQGLIGTIRGEFGTKNLIIKTGRLRKPKTDNFNFSLALLF